jgi:HK97 family phage major capsid protein
MKTTIAEQVALYEAKLKAANDAVLAIVNKSIEEGRSLDESEAEERTGHLAEVKAIEQHIVVLRETEAQMLKAAKPVEQIATPDDVRTHVSVKSNLPPGVRFTRFAKCMAVAKGNIMQAHEIAKTYYKDTPEVINALQAAVRLGSTSALVEKAAVDVGTGRDSDWAGPLVQYQDMASEFIELLRPKMILGRLTQVRRVPFMMRAARQLTGVTGAFVGEGAPKPVGRQTYDNVTLSYAKAAVIVVMTDELIKFSNPQADVLARDDMVAGISTYLDKRFIDPSYSGVANVSPASITNAATRIQSSGTTIAAIDTDVRTAMAMFATSDIDPSTAAWVMSPSTALRLSMKRTTQDEFAFPGISMTGGTWYGLPVITSSAVVSAGSPGENHIVLVTQNEVLLADEGSVAIDMSTEASLQMDDAPSAGATSLVSLWQNNLVGIRAERYINWAARRPSNLGIAVIENVTY